MNLLVAVLASILSGFVIYANKLLPTTLINKLEFDAIKQQLSYSYFATYQHMGPYCLGLLVGYLLHKRPHARLPKHLTWLLWLLLPPLSFTTLLLTYLWNGAYPEANLINPSPLVSALYVAIHRTIWSALIAWIVFACATGRAKLLANFLSNPIFLPISRLSYSIYLVHLPVIMFRALNLRHTLEWTDQNILWEACGNFIVSSLLGFFLNVAFESPIINLENALFKRNRNSSAILSPSSKQTTNDIYHRNKLVGLTTGHPDKQQSCGNAPVSATLNTNSQRAYSTSSNSSDGCEDSMAGSVTHQADGRVRKSLRPKQSASVEQIFGRSTKTGAGQMHLQVPEELKRFNESQSTNYTSTRRKQHQQEKVDILDHHDNNDVSHDGLQTSASSSFSEQIALPSSSAVDAGQATPRQRVQDHGYKDNSDDLYSIAAEYRHYAPGSYQQWRRAVQQLDMSNQRHQQPMANSTSMRSMQYATLARTNRPRQDPTIEVSHQYGRHNRQYHLDRSYQQQQQQQQQHQQQFVDTLPYDDHHNQMVTSRYDRLFPNSSELSYGHDATGVVRSALTHQRQLLASRRHHGRYNTLTGTGSRDWRSQIQSQRNPNRLNTADTDLINSWDQQQPWMAASGLQLGPPSDGSLLIPRIDWSSTLRRTARTNGHQAAPASAGVTVAVSQSGSSLIDRQDQSDDRKIMEEPSVEADETSAL